MPYLLPFTLSYSVILAIAYERAMSTRASTRSTFSKFLHISHFICKFSSRQYQSLSFSLSSYLSHCSFNVIFWFLFILYFYYTYFYWVRGRLLERLRLLRSTSKVSTDWKWKKREWEGEKKGVRCIAVSFTLGQ